MLMHSGAWKRGMVGMSRAAHTVLSLPRLCHKLKEQQMAKKRELPADWGLMDAKERHQWQRMQPARHVWALSMRSDKFAGLPLVKLSVDVNQEQWFEIRGAIEFAQTAEAQSAAVAM